MHSALAPGLTHIQSLEMEDCLILQAGGREGTSALATAFVVGLIEWACIEALRPYLEEGEETVGNHVYLSHGAPASVSHKLTAIAELVAVKGPLLRFRVDCFDECDQIGSGFHERKLIARAASPADGRGAARFFA